METAETDIANMREQVLLLQRELSMERVQNELRAAELLIANKELVFQNIEKEKRAAELLIANSELVFQNMEKEKRAAELHIANKELHFQNEEKHKRAEELISINKELLTFNFVWSHDLQEPLRKIQTFITIILAAENDRLSEKGKYNFERVQASAARMQQLIEDLLSFSRVNTGPQEFEHIELDTIVEKVIVNLKDTIITKHAVIDSVDLSSANVIPAQFQQLMHNLLSNALKFSAPGVAPHIVIKSEIVSGSAAVNEKLTEGKIYCHISVSDRGIGFEQHFSERIFDLFQKLHGKEVYSGTGIGLAIVKKIVTNHNGIITATGVLDHGATFDIYLPTNEAW